VALLKAARLAWLELKCRFGWLAFLPFLLLLALAAFLGLLASVPALAPFVYPLF